MKDDPAQWLIDGVPGAETPPEIFSGLCQRLVAASIAVERAAVFIRSLHPTVMGRRFLWQRGDEVEISEAPYSVLLQSEFRRSPAAYVQNSGKALRRRLHAGEGVDQFEVLSQLAGSGYTDYLIEPLKFTSGECHAVSWVTRKPDGFSPSEISSLERISAPLARIGEIFALRRVAANLLDAYVGHKARERILRGAIRCGDTETIRAVIMIGDLRGFTVLSNTQPAGEVTAVINAFFDASFAPIEQAGGEILKLMGDGFLAILRCTEDSAATIAACRSAIDTARCIRGNVEALNSARGGAWQVQFGLSIHLGDVIYGNIGSTNRLDFTTIGPAVNLAARLQTVAADRKRDIILSADIAGRSDQPVEDLGMVEMKGFDGPGQAFALI